MNATPRKMQVTDIRQETPQVRRFTLRPVDGRRLPAWSSGSHIAVAFGDAAQTWRSCYSLIGESGDDTVYQIAVQRAGPSLSRGGSHFLHDRIKPGDALEVSGPVNYFPVARPAKKHLLIAGGIGITPFLSQMETLQKAKQPFELHYAFRSRREGAFCDTICERYGARAHYYISEEGSRLSPALLLADQPLGTHVSICGPNRLISAVAGAAAELGWPSAHVHFEEFSAPLLSDAAPFSVSVPALGLEVKVGMRETLLEALERAGVPMASSCRVGMCGTCEMRVLEGEAEHRDRCLSEGEIADGKIIACVSRCRGERLTLAPPDGRHSHDG